MPIAPLDIFLLRSHSLPLPYLLMPSISFLTYLSPSAYLSLLRNAKTQNTSEGYPPIDISLADLKTGIESLSNGVTLATLYLNKLSETHLYPPSMSMPNPTTRPTFHLLPSASDIDHAFPQLDGLGMDDNPPGLGSTTSEPYAWVLDFTESGKRSGVVMNQSRMKAIELIVNPLGGGDGLNAVTDVLSMGSWVDLLVCYSILSVNPHLIYNQLHPGLNHVSSERYTSLYVSHFTLFG